MTRRELRHLLIIYYLLHKIRFVIEQTNAHIANQETLANERVQELLRRQVEIDSRGLDTWEGNAEELWKENQELTAQITELKRKLATKRKAQRQWERES